jgi:cephalosporin hydroxylase
MEHFYQDIPGWFDFEEIYHAFVATAPSPSHFVEVGAWYGKSAAFMAVEISNSKKNIRFDVVDHWEGSWEHNEGGVAVDENLVTSGSVFDQFLKYTAPVRDLMTPVKAPSVEASKRYADGSLDMVFLDASHKYADVSADLAAWYPKVRHGGIISGHDFTLSWPGVVKAVTEFPPFVRERILKAGSCWVYHKE